MGVSSIPAEAQTFSRCENKTAAKVRFVFLSKSVLFVMYLSLLNAVLASA